MKRRNGRTETLIIVLVFLLAADFLILRLAWNAWEIWRGGDMLASFLIILGGCGVLNALILMGAVYRVCCDSRAAAWALTLASALVITGGWFAGYMAVYPADFAEAQGKLLTPEKDRHSYSYDESSGVLRIGGRGPLCSGEGRDDTLPWAAYQIRTLILEEGVSGIGTAAFQGHEELETVSLPDSLLYISYNAFEGCGALKEVRLPSGLKRLRSGAFSSCAGLRKVYIPAGIGESWIGAFGQSGFVRIETENESRYAVYDCPLLRAELYLVMAPAGSAAAKAAEERGYRVIGENIPETSSFYEWMRASSEGASLTDEQWKMLYLTDFLKADSPQAALRLTWDYRQLFRESGRDTKELLAMAVPIASHGWTAGTFRTETDFTADADTWSDQYAAAAEGKILPAAREDGKRWILPALLAGLPEERIPTQPEQAEYFLELHYEGRDQGHYTDGRRGYMPYCILELVSAADGSVKARGEIDGGMPEMEKYGSGDGYGSLPDKERIAESICLLISEIEKPD